MFNLFFQKLFCSHSDRKFVRNLYGDEIRSHGNNRSVWRCTSCSKVCLSPDLHESEESYLEDGLSVPTLIARSPILAASFLLERKRRIETRVEYVLRPLVEEYAARIQKMADSPTPPEQKELEELRDLIQRIPDPIQRLSLFTSLNSMFCAPPPTPPQNDETPDTLHKQVWFFSFNNGTTAWITDPKKYEQILRYLSPDETVTKFVPETHSNKE